MGNSGVAAIPLPPEGRRDGAAGGDDLARGLMLVRASAIKMARLHLAMERRDRRLVLETMDDLVALDGRIRDLVEAIPTSDSGIGIMQDELEEQRIALAREKLILAAGISRKQAPLPPARAPVPEEEFPKAEPTTAAEAAPSEPAFEASDEWRPAHEQGAPRDRAASLFGLAALLVLALAIAGALFLFGTAESQEVARLTFPAAGA